MLTGFPAVFVRSPDCTVWSALIGIGSSQSFYRVSTIHTSSFHFCSPFNLLRGKPESTFRMDSRIVVFSSKRTAFYVSTGPICRVCNITLSDL